MTWKFHVLATEQQRTFSRILQILETQLVSIHYFVGEISEAGAAATFQVSSEEDKAYRIEALMHRLEAIYRVSVEPVPTDTGGSLSSRAPLAKGLR